MKKDYKVETKPSYWKVTLSHGCYSDASEEHLFFSGNSEDEVWIFLCRYIDDIASESKYSWDKKNLKWANKKHENKYSEYENDFDTDYGYCYEVDIKRLNVIYFKN